MEKREPIKADRDRPLILLLLLAVLALGAWARLVNAGSSASLWFDEAWRIECLLNADSLLRQTVSPPNHIDPPAFSLAIYLLAQVHNTELVLRLVSIIPGVLAILAAWLVGRQLFSGKWLPLFCAFLIAFSPWAASFSKELKPYSLGLLVHLAVLFGFLRFSRAPTVKSTALFAATLILALFCATTIVFAYPGICILMLAMALEAGKGRKSAAMLGACAALLAASVLYYILLLHGPDGPQSYENLTSFWRDDFCPKGSVSSAAGWFFHRYLSFYSKMAFTDYSVFPGAGAILGMLYPLMALSGAVIILFRSRRHFLQLFCLLLMPVLVMIPFNILVLWPFGPLRMNLFLMAYIVFPPLILIDQWQWKPTRANRCLPAGLVAAVLMALQFPIGWNDFARQREAMRESAQALASILDYRPDHPPIPLLVSRPGLPQFDYYSRHHATMSKRFKAAAKNFSPLVLAGQNSRLYATGLLLRQCQAHRQVAVFAGCFNSFRDDDRILHHNDFCVGHHEFDGNNIHSRILDSEITGYEEDRRPLFSSRRYRGENESWKAVHISRPLPLDGLLPGTLVVVNFELKFFSGEKSIRFGFIDQDGSSKPFAPSITQSTTEQIPQRIESAVYTKIRKPVEYVRLVVKTSGEFDFVLQNVNCFATRANQEDEASSRP